MGERERQADKQGATSTQDRSGDELWGSTRRDAIALESQRRKRILRRLRQAEWIGYAGALISLFTLGYAAAFTYRIVKYRNRDSIEIAASDFWQLFAVMATGFLVSTILIHVSARRYGGRADRGVAASKVDVRQRVTAGRDRLPILRDRAISARHLLLASEIDSALSGYTNMAILVSGAPGVDLRLIVESFLDKNPVAEFERRVRRARLSYFLNLPLTHESALNFAVARMEQRVNRVSNLIAPYLPPSTQEDRSRV